MARPIPTKTQEAVLEVIARFPDGASVEQIEADLTAPPNRRTLSSADAKQPSSSPSARSVIRDLANAPHAPQGG